MDQFPADLFKFTKEALTGKFYFCVVLSVHSLCRFITMLKYGN